MENLTFENILILAVFFLPGFIYLKAYRLLLPETKTDFSKDLYEAIGLSFMNALVFSYPLFYIHKTELILHKPFLYFLIMFSIILIAPIFVAWIFSVLSKKNGFLNT